MENPKQTAAPKPSVPNPRALATEAPRELPVERLERRAAVKRYASEPIYVGFGSWEGIALGVWGFGVIRMFFVFFSKYF